MKSDVPVVSLQSTHLDTYDFGERYQGRGARLGEQLGLTHLGASYDELPPGKRACPFHNHHANDELYVIVAGSGTYRCGGREFAVAAGDVLGAPAGGRDTAHQLINTGSETLRFLVISSMRDPDICEYPDSGKFYAFAKGDGEARFRYVGRPDSAVNYWDGE
jgi:uncharacterized cupin superfamily protein